jgi:Spy/CpxP family protein refolding chaperone
LAEQLGLSEEKRGTLEAIRKKYKDRMEELFIKSRETREAIRAELAKDEPDQVKIDALLEAMPSLEILRLTTQENLETMQTLTAEQRKLALEWHKKRDFRRKPPRPKDEKSPKSSANP